MAYEDDKRIRDLNTGSSMPLNWRLPLDFTGLAAAEYRTLQQLVDIVNNNLLLPNITAGSTNPDNAFGNNGDTYYKYSTSAFSVWFKSSDVWAQLFEIILSRVVTGTSDVNGEYIVTGTVPGTPNVTIYDVNDDSSPATYNKTTKTIKFLNPSEAFTAVFS